MQNAGLYFFLSYFTLSLASCLGHYLLWLVLVWADPRKTMERKIEKKIKSGKRRKFKKGKNFLKGLSYTYSEREGKEKILLKKVFFSWVNTF